MELNEPVPSWIVGAPFWPACCWRTRRLQPLITLAGSERRLGKLFWSIVTAFDHQRRR
jgi:hypothetical protein